jgi:tetratricopeptide (TPR) repeat protein
MIHPMPRLCPPGKFERALELFDDDPTEGIAELERLAKKYAKDPEVRYALGAAYLDLGQPFDALDHLEWSEKKAPTPHARRALANAYVRLEMFTHAARVARREPGLQVDAAPESGAEATSGALPLKDQLAFERARVAILRGDPGGVRAMRDLSKRHPDYPPARNVVATGYFVQGDLAGFRDATHTALHHAPNNLHALLNAVRLAFLEDGVEGAQAYRQRVLDAGEAASESDPSARLTQAQALAMMDDVEAVENIVDTWYEQHGPEHASDQDLAARDQLEAYLDVRDEDPRAPLMRLHDVLFGFLRRWLETAQAEPFARVGAALAEMPGIVSLLPRTIGYESPILAELLTRAVLTDDAPPAPDARGWPEVLREVVEHGPGERDTRVRIATILGELGFLAENEKIAFDGSEDGLEFQKLELFYEQVPSGLPAKDDARYQKAMQALMDDDIERAEKELAKLHEEYPEAVAVYFNLALAERMKGGSAAVRSRERMERIVREHPGYLFARAQLAVDAIEAGDLTEARELLTLPKESKRFHVHAYATFVAAQGRLALARGDVEDAEHALDTIQQVAGDESGPYGMLDDAIYAHQTATRLVDTLGEDDEDLLDEFEDGFDDAFEEDAFEDTAAAWLVDDEDSEDAEPPSRADISGLLEVRETWQVAHGPIAFIGAEGAPLKLAYGGIVVQEDGLLRHFALSRRPFDGPALYGLVASACAAPVAPVPACRPRTVLVQDEARALSLSLQLSGTPIAVRAGDVSKAQDVFAVMSDELQPDTPPTFLSEHDASRIDAFFDAAHEFFDAEPWNKVEGDTFLAFRLEDGPWHYASVIGQQGEEFGLSLFERWATVASIIEDAGVANHEDLVGGVVDGTERPDGDAMESISLAPLAYLAPVDAACYVEREIEPYFEDEYPIIIRYTSDGQDRPQLDLAVYTALLEAVAERARSARIRVQAFEEAIETEAGVLHLRFPATGDASLG